MAEDETMADFWRDVKPAMQEASQQRRASNRDNSAALLRANGVQFESKNGGAHLVVRDGIGRIFDFWPGTGLWQLRGTPQRWRGVHSLLGNIRKHATKTKEGQSHD